MESKQEAVVTDDRVQTPIAITDDMIDPAAAIVTILQASGHTNPTAWLAGIDPDALDENVDKLRRRFLVNRQWRLIIGAFPEDTAAARYCLQDDCTLTTWLTLFEESVLPVIMKHNQPLAG